MPDQVRHEGIVQLSDSWELSGGDCNDPCAAQSLIRFPNDAPADLESPADLNLGGHSVAGLQLTRPNIR